MKKLTINEWIAVSVSLAVIAGFFLLSDSIRSTFFGISSNESSSATASLSFEAAEENTTDADRSLPDFGVKDLKVGSGETARPGELVTVHYTGRFPDGRTFDSSLTRGEPFQFVLGAGQVIEGWEKGVVGMKVGGQRLLVIPPELGYGDRQVGIIPPNSTLIFEIELLGVESP
jgi:FKBP-type peptidyl-prolyl cis-trans isomerase